MYPRDESPSESEDHLYRWFSNIGILGGCFRKYVYNKYPRIKIWYSKYDPILYLKYRKTCVEFHKNIEKGRHEEDKLRQKNLVKYPLN